MKYYCFTLTPEYLMELQSEKKIQYITYAIPESFTLPNNIVIAEQLADFSYYVFGELAIDHNNRLIVFIGMPDEFTPLVLDIKNYVELPKKITRYTPRSEISTLLVSFE